MQITFEKKIKFDKTVNDLKRSKKGFMDKN